MTTEIRQANPDFSVLWTSAVDLLNRQNPYTNPSLFTVNAYPPNTLILYIPFALLPYRIALGAFTLFSFLSLPAIIYICLKLTFKKIDRSIFLACLSLALISFPTKFTLGMGQVNLVAYLALLSAYYCSTKKKFQLSGLLLGLAILFKPVLAFFVLFFGLNRRWKTVLFSAIIPLLSVALICIFFNSNLFVYWSGTILPQLSGFGGSQVYYNQGLIGFISRLTPDLDDRLILNNLFSIMVFGLSLFFAVKNVKNSNFGFSLWIISLLLLDVFSSQHHFVWLIFPFIYLAHFASRTRKTWLWILLLAAYALVSWNFKNPGSLAVFPWSLALSHTFYGNLLLYILMLNVLFPKKSI